MSIIHLTQIKSRIEKEFFDIIDMSDVKHKIDSQEYIDAKHARCLAAYIVHHFTGCSASIAAGAIVDGSDDNGIDAIYWDNSDFKLYIIQSKWIKSGTGEPEAKDVGRFTKGIRDLLSLNFERFNNRITNRKDELLNILSTAGLQIIAILVHTGNSGPSKHSQAEFNDLLSEINDAGEILSYRHINQSHLYQSLTDDLDSPISANITIRNWGKVQEPYYAIYGQVSAADLADLWKNNKDRIFTKNLRGSLGDTDVNNEIKQTLSEHSELFWYFNNGVTAIADKVEKLALGGHKHDIGHFQCDGLYIVNGAQTVSSIGNFSEKNKSKDLSDSSVHFRVISLENSSATFGSDVTRTNNRQNKIEVRDFVAQDDEQKRIRTELLIDDINYQIMRGDDFTRGPNSFDLQDSTTALACASGETSIIVLLKNNIGKIWEDISKSPYKTLFNPNISGKYVWRCVQVHRRIDEEISRANAQYKKARELRVLSAGNRAIAAIFFNVIKKENIASTTFDFDNFITHENIGLVMNYIISETINHVQRFYQNSFITNLFKNQSKTRDVIENISRNTTREFSKEIKLMSLSVK